MGAPLEIRAWRPGDAPVPEAFPPASLVGRPLLAPLDERVWRWAFAANPAGTRLFLAWRDGRVVARYGALPVRTRVPGPQGAAEARTFACLLGGWTGEGEETLRATAEAFLAAHGGPEGDLVHYGWPDAPELAFGQAYLGHELLRTGSLFVRALGSGPTELPGPVRAVERFGPEADELYACCATHWNASAIRDAAFLNWRFLDAPARRYRVLAFQSGATLRGYAVVGGGAELDPRLALLVDWLVLPGDDEASAALLAGALATARATGAAALATALPEWSPWAQHFQAQGFRHHATPHLATLRASVPRFDMLWLRDAWWNTLADALAL
ncbi:MAG TPA: hypothetical protein VF530_07765 [Planctomycetota bacterium]